MTDVDINKVIATPAQASGDPGQALRAREIAGWSHEEARKTAQAEGLELGPAHFAVIELLRTLYVNKGPAPHARQISALLNEHFANDGGSKYLYELFPGGPVAQGSRLAGVPAPSDARDLSFGSTY